MARLVGGYRLVSSGVSGGMEGEEEGSSIVPGPTGPVFHYMSADD
jgi:6-phosphogluconate dehydrogenase